MAVSPHGGALVNRLLTPEETEHWMQDAPGLPALTLGWREVLDLRLIGNGAYSPLSGFMTREDYQDVVEHMHLRAGPVWTIPVTLGIPVETAATLHDGAVVLLRDVAGRALGTMEVRDRYTYRRERAARKIYQTEDITHPGVRALYEQDGVLIGGPVQVFADLADEGAPLPALTPAQTRERSARLGWQTVVGAQAHQPVHRTQEYIHKCALEMADGLLLHALVGDSLPDLPTDARLRSYTALLDAYYSTRHVVLSTLAIWTRHAGPREAVLRALIQKNYGCTHCVIEHDYGGVGNFYGRYDVRHIFTELEAERLGITPLFFEQPFYCQRCGGMASSKTCPHGDGDHIKPNGVQLWATLRGGHMPPVELSRPEVAEVLLEAMQQLPS